MTSDGISATMTHVMWREEHLWNASVPQIVYLSSLVIPGEYTEISKLHV
jgi:hypothetical protein